MTPPLTDLISRLERASGAAGTQWLHTAQHPRSGAKGYDAGRKGWKSHAVQAREDETFTSVGRRKALCGLRPAHGWTIDLFIPVDEEPYLCSRCRKALLRSLEAAA